MSQPRCTKCQVSITPGVAYFSLNDGAVYHDTCFTCSICNLPLPDKFVKKENQVMHQDCFIQHKAHSCQLCRTPIGPSQRAIVLSSGIRVHDGCFVCAKCGGKLPERFATKDDKYYHTECYGDLYAPKCNECKRAVQAGSPYFEFDDFRFHRECFKCVECSTPLASSSFKPLGNGRFKCEKCVRKETQQLESRTNAILASEPAYLRKTLSDIAKSSQSDSKQSSTSSTTLPSSPSKKPFIAVQQPVIGSPSKPSQKSPVTRRPSGMTSSSSQDPSISAFPSKPSQKSLVSAPHTSTISASHKYPSVSTRPTISPSPPSTKSPSVSQSALSSSTKSTSIQPPLPTPQQQPRNILLKPPPPPPPSKPISDLSSRLQSTSLESVSSTDSPPPPPPPPPPPLTSSSTPSTSIPGHQPTTTTTTTSTPSSKSLDKRPPKRSLSESLLSEIHQKPTLRRVPASLKYDASEPVLQVGSSSVSQRGGGNSGVGGRRVGSEGDVRMALVSALNKMRATMVEEEEWD